MGRYQRVSEHDIRNILTFLKKNYHENIYSNCTILFFAQTILLGVQRTKQRTKACIVILVYSLFINSIFDNNILFLIMEYLDTEYLKKELVSLLIEIRDFKQ